MSKCNNCYHKKICIDGANYKTAESCKHYVSEDDVVEVVRCKDCVYYEKGKDYTPYCNHINGLDHVNDDYYCSYGERKEYE